MSHIVTKIFIPINTQCPEKRGWGLERPKGESWSEYILHTHNNVLHLFQTNKNEIQKETSNY